jgi:hypothetical protein
VEKLRQWQNKKIVEGEDWDKTIEDACDSTESQFELHKMQGLPGDIKWIVSNNWQYRDEVYFEVIKGMKELLK